MTTPIVFFDIAGPDLSTLIPFYRAVFGWDANERGGLSVPVNGPPLMGTFRPDPAETMLYLGVPDITAALAKVVEHGGKVAAPRFEVPGVVVLGMFHDPAGNRLGLVEMDGAKARIP